MSDNKKKGKYFPNNYKDVFEAPSDMFPEVDALDVIEKDWSMRPGKNYIVRGLQRGDTFSVIEKSFQLQHAAIRFVKELDEKDYEITIATPELIGVIGDQSPFGSDEPVF